MALSKTTIKRLDASIELWKANLDKVSAEIKDLEMRLKTVGMEISLPVVGWVHPSHNPENPLAVKTFRLCYKRKADWIPMLECKVQEKLDAHAQLDRLVRAIARELNKASVCTPE